MWLLFALLTTFSWAFADLFYEKGADPTDKISHIKTVIMVGLVIAMAQNAIIVAPLIASYSVFSVLLSRIFLKERLDQKQYVVILLVIIGIALLAISEVL